MKSLKKFFLTMAVAMVFSTSAFAASGFEFLLNLSGGIGAVIPNQTAKDLELKGVLGVDAGIDAQIGYMFQVKERFGISVLAELGYNFNMYLFDGPEQIPNASYTSYGGSTTPFDSKLLLMGYYHNFKLGLLPKFNIGLGGRHGLAVGIGGGVKIPLAGWLEHGYTGLNAAGDGTEFNGIDMKLNRKDISDMFSPSVIGYMKVTFDYYLFFTDNIAMNFGLYLGGDFGMKQKLTEIGGNAFNFGLQLGFRFGPKA